VLSEMSYSYESTCIDGATFNGTKLFSHLIARPLFQQRFKVVQLTKCPALVTPTPTPCFSPSIVCRFAG